MNTLFKHKYAAAGLVLCAALIIFGKNTSAAALSGFEMWLCFVMPSIFPFFICTSLMRESGLLNVKKRGAATTLFLSCSLSGAPSGSRICSYLQSSGSITDDKLSSFCAVCNMVSPAFITGMIAQMGGKSLVIPVLIGHYAAAFIMLIFMRKSIKITSDNKKLQRKPFSEALCDSIWEATVSSIRVCGIIVFFTVIISIILSIMQLLKIDILNPVCVALLCMTEATNACSLLCSLGLSFQVLCAALAAVLSFGGLCIATQASTFAKIDMKKYLFTKLILAAFSGLIAYITACIFPAASPVISSSDEMLRAASSGSVSLCVIALGSVIGCAVIWLFCSGKRKKRV